MQLHLDRAEAQFLRRVLDYYLSELRMEIADTDRSSFRDTLRHDEESLRTLVERLDAALEQDQPS